MSDKREDEYPDAAGYPDGEGTLEEGAEGALPADPEDSEAGFGDDVGTKDEAGGPPLEEDLPATEGDQEVTD